jgi:hypothetical protein
MIRPEDQRLLQPYLLPGERLLWAGTPKPGFTFQFVDLWPLAFIAVWTGLNVLVGRRPDDLLLDPVTFGLVMGLLWVVATRLYEPWLRRNLLYTVTNKRLVIVSGRLLQDLRSYDLAWLPKLDLEQQGRDRGDIIVAADGPPARWRLLPRDSKTELSDEFRFCRIENPVAVYDLICRASRDRCLELHRAPENDFIGGVCDPPAHEPSPWAASAPSPG